jgi:hypothetical protein
MRKIIIFIAFLVICTSGNAQIKINSSNIEAYRDSIRIKIFGQKTLPSYVVDSVFSNVTTLRYMSRFPFSNLPNLKKIDMFVTKLMQGIADVPTYVYYPIQGNGELFVYHSGHCVANTAGEDITTGGGDTIAITIPRLIAEGYTVLTVPMLYYNVVPATYNFAPLTGIADCTNNHDLLFSQKNYSDTLIRNFFKCVLASLNKLGRQNFSKISMIGLSGGGWTASIYPAIDTSIRYSFPIAGSAPKRLWGAAGDYEQQYPAIFDNFLGYEDMYVLSAAGQGRKVIQVNNRYDGCCFFGLKHIYYVDSVKARLKQLGYENQYAYFLDESHTGHKISQKALLVVLNTTNSARLNELPSTKAYPQTEYVYDIKGNIRGIEANSMQLSLLIAPSWLTLQNGLLKGTPPAFSNDTVSVQIVDAKGNFILHSYKIDVSSITSIQELQGVVSVFPNPATQKVFVRGAKAGISIKIFDAKGLLINSEISTGFVHEINMSTHPKGIYIVRVSDAVIKLIKI